MIIKTITWFVCLFEVPCNTYIQNKKSLNIAINNGRTKAINELDVCT